MTFNVPTLRGLKSKMLNVGSQASETGPLSFFTQWFNPNNLIGSLQQLEQYKGITYACVSAIAEDVGKIKFTMNRELKDGTLEPITDHDFLRVLKNPNPTQSDYEFMEMTQTHIELTGEAFWYVPKGKITSKPKELWIMRPDLVQIVYDKDTGEVTGYVYTKNNGRTQIPLDLDEVVHFKMPNPINPYRGMGTVQAGIVYIQTEDYASRFSRNFLANNATPAGIVNFKGTIADTEFQKVKRQWTREYGNVENAGKTAFVRSADITYQKIGSSLEDIDLKELKSLTRDDIMFMFRVSKPILGITEDVNYSNAQTAEYIFAKRVIDPKMLRIVDTLQTFYNKKYKDSYHISYVTPIPQNNEEKIAYYKAGINMWLTPNEVRSEEGLEPIDGGDGIRMPFNLQRIDANSTTRTAQPAATEPAAKTIHKRYVLKKKPSRTEDKVVLQDSELADTKENFRVLLVNTAKAYAPQIEYAVAEAMGKMRGRVMSQLKIIKKRDLAEDIDYDPELTRQELVAGMTPVVNELMSEAGKYAMQLADNTEAYDLNHNTMSRIQERIEKVAKDYTDETRAALMETIRNGISQGLTLTQLAGEVSNVFSGATGWRATRLARTESMHEANYATLDAYMQSGVESKEWYAGGGDPCQYCSALNGEVIETDENFVTMGKSLTGLNGGTFLADYQDIEAGDLHPNCECTILPVAGKDLSEDEAPTVYHGESGEPFASDSMLGNAFYVARDKDIAEKFGDEISAYKLTIKPEDILLIKTDKEYEDLIKNVIAAYLGEDTNTSIPKYIRAQGYKAAEIAENVDPLGGIAIYNKKYLPKAD